MTSPIASAISITWRRNRDYALRLVADLSDAQMLAQPPGLPEGVLMNHPAWIISHLNVYAPIVASMLRRQPFVDPFDHPHGQKSKVSADPGAYLPRAALIEQFTRLHDHAAAALADAPDSVFAEPNPLERWRTVHPTVGDMLVTLMVKHESGHLGQLSAWRRAMGLPSVAM